MKNNHFDKESRLTGTLAQHSFSDVTELVKDVFAGTPDQEKKMTYWQLIFLQSKANGCFYRSEDIPHVRWQWPKETWFQERLSQKLRDTEIAVQRLTN